MDFYKYSHERLFGILVECPCAKDVPECPLNNYRTGDLKDRAHMAFEAMSESEVIEILQLHENCDVCGIPDSRMLDADTEADAMVESM